MASFFNAVTNPLTTAVGAKIALATDGSQSSENWELFMTICDMINGTEEGPKDASRAIRKRLFQNAGKNNNSVMLTLTLLETCVKNCGHKFHLQVCNKDFLQELIKILGPKYCPPVNVQEKVLSLIQSWADAFRNQADLCAVVQVYRELKAKGIEFPMTDLDAMAPIHTPRKVLQEPSISKSAKVEKDPYESLSEKTSYIPEEQLAKLRNELDVVENNASVFNEMLTEMEPGKEDPSDVQLLTELYETCKEMHDRLVELVSTIGNSVLTADLLRVNDNLNNLFLRYKRYESNKKAQLVEAHYEMEPESLIDLSDDLEPLKTQMSDLGLHKKITPSTPLGVAGPSKSFMSPSKNKKESQQMQSQNGKNDSEFDMFAQSRNLTYENTKKGGSTYDDNIRSDQLNVGLSTATNMRNQPTSLMHTESDFDEMAAWLQETSVQEHEANSSLTSGEFERFLAERAAAADHLPSVTTADPSDRSPAHKKKDGKEKEMFAL